MIPPPPSNWPHRFIAVAWLCLLCSGHAATYYLHSQLGDDSNPGTNQRTPFRTLKRATSLPLQPGDRILLAAGQTYSGQLTLDGVAGTLAAPILISTYSPEQTTTDNPARIDAAGHLAGVYLRNSAHVQIENLHITGNGGSKPSPSPSLSPMRCGILVHADHPGTYAGFRLTNLLIHDVCFQDPGYRRAPNEARTANGTQPYGWGVRFIVNSADTFLKDVTLQDCTITNVSHTALKFTAPTNGIQNVAVQRLRVLNSGGPGVQMSGLRHGRFSGLDITGSGSTNDTRNWGRGSGLWTWTTSDVVVERSRFTHANGPADSAGVHVDFHCRNIIVQHNLSANNAGGFCEVLGDNHNIAYRYNLSINDGSRIKGVNGAFQEGKTFWLSGYTGDKGPRVGPFNTYFYNNTIYVDDSIDAKFAVTPTARGVLIANNIFYIKGPSQTSLGDQNRADNALATPIPGVVFKNNLFLRPDSWPTESPLQDKSPILGDPHFQKPGGLNLEDYLPGNSKLVRNRGIRIPRLPGDELGLFLGLQVKQDLLGNPIRTRPDLGAIELPR